MVVFLLKFVILSQAKCVEIFSADRLFLWTPASQSPLFAIAKYSGLHFAHKPSVLLRICFQSFSLRSALKNTLEKNFQLVSDFIFLHPSFYFFSPFLFLRVHERQIISLLILESFNLFAGVFCKSFLPPHYNWKVTSRLSGYFTKISQKNCREIFPTTACKKEVRLYQTSFYSLYFLIVFYFLL